MAGGVRWLAWERTAQLANLINNRWRGEKEDATTPVDWLPVEMQNELEWPE